MTGDPHGSSAADAERHLSALAVVGSGPIEPSVLQHLAAALPGWRNQAATDSRHLDRQALSGLGAADATLIVAGGCDALAGDLRRAVLLAWGIGARPVIVIDAEGGKGIGGSYPVAAEVAELARGLPGLEARCFALPAEATALSTYLGERHRSAAQTEPARFWIETMTEGAAGSLVRGRLASGQLAAGMPVVAMPGAIGATVARVVGDEVHLDRTLPGAGHVLLAAAGARPEFADQVAAHVVWAGASPLLPGRTYILRLGRQTVTAQISTLKHKVNPIDLDPIAARRLEQGELGLCNLSFSAPLLFDPFERSPATSRFSLSESRNGDVAGFGRIIFTLRRATNIHWQALSVDKGARAGLKGQQPCCLWLTGLSGSGKSTVASLLEKRLNATGRHTYTLDGDNVRHGLNRDLGFTDADRVENIRRIAEVAKLFVDSGLIVLVSFISPFRAERRMARELLPASEFIEIFVDTPIEICEQRDPKGLYKKARAGALKNFTGIDSPYEPPERAEIHLKAGEAAPEALVDTIYRELERRGIV